MWWRSEHSRAWRQSWSAVPYSTWCRFHTEKWHHNSRPWHTSGSRPNCSSQGLPWCWISGILGPAAVFLITAHMHSISVVIWMNCDGILFYIRIFLQQCYIHIFSDCKTCKVNACVFRRLVMMPIIVRLSCAFLQKFTEWYWLLLITWYCECVWLYVGIFWLAVIDDNALQSAELK